MARSQRRSRRKPTGGLYKKDRKKRKAELGRPNTETHVGSVKRRKIRVRGGNFKLRLLRADKANVYLPSEKRTVSAEIVDVEDNPANKDFARRKIITKGAIIQTSVGKAVVTSRPGQHGIINAVLIENAS